MKNIKMNYKKINKNYLIYPEGRVYSVRRGIFLKTSIDKYGYEKVVISENSRPIYTTVHRLVAIAFIPNPENKPQVNHINDIKTDNRVENLEWATPTENLNHGSRSRKAALSNSIKVYQYTKKGEFIREWESHARTEDSGFSPSSVSACCRKELKTHKGFLWSLEKITDKHKLDAFVKRCNSFKKTRFKKVGRFSLDGKLIKIYESGRSAEKDGFNQSDISRNCNGKTSSHKGYLWRFI